MPLSDKARIARLESEKAALKDTVEELQRVVRLLARLSDEPTIPVRTFRITGHVVRELHTH